jgi:hypothetical protein
MVKRGDKLAHRVVLREVNPTVDSDAIAIHMPSHQVVLKVQDFV